MFNEPNEAALLKKWFQHMREVRLLPAGWLAGLHAKPAVVCNLQPLASFNLS